MSFSSDTKIELCKETPRNSCCQKAECYGLLLFGRAFSGHAITLTTESGAAAHLAAQLTAETIGVIVDLSASVLRRKERKNAFTVTINGSEQRSAVLDFFGHDQKEMNLRINHSNMEDECCASAFLRGAFLSCGTVTDPAKDYRLEFTVPFMNLARDLSAFISGIYELDLQPGLLNRKGAFVVYIKGGERVADFLTYMGAGNAAMELMQAKMLKEVRNNVNRKTNFETANIDKTASAAAAQIIAIEKIRNTAGLDALPEELREIADLRYRNPDMSLRELGGALSEPLSRSGVNHRLQRIVDIAGSL
ncbi:DNA-binding protein WhiA [Caproiciproducens galactitolivorans]|uniref:Probable cell division protein WhiA n=1 Tax=Caproiciproducens galactitolivorans TaxID=642589 RepID=A0ABT4BY23_9FIRM|nr:DNA-binding protein WhiA [Caproiciproducens galactitolivorans]MCY1714821.1 DNA-binding protein WhiA [Caproiciproducens galactitolivorans]